MQGFILGLSLTFFMFPSHGATGDVAETVMGPAGNPHVEVTPGTRYPSHLATPSTYRLPLELQTETAQVLGHLTTTTSPLLTRLVFVIAPCVIAGAGLSAGMSMGAPETLILGAISGRVGDVIAKEMSHRPKAMCAYAKFKLKYSLSDRLLLIDMLFGYQQRVNGKLGYPVKVYLSTDASGKVTEGFADYEFSPPGEDEMPLSPLSDADLFARKVSFDRIEIVRPCMKILREAAYYVSY